MAKPVGTGKTKDNSRKKPAEREDWMAGKKVGRPKQIWVEDTNDSISKTGHWEKTRG